LAKDETPTVPSPDRPLGTPSLDEPTTTTKSLKPPSNPIEGVGGVDACWLFYNAGGLTGEPDVEALRECLFAAGVILDETTINPATGLPIGAAANEQPREGDTNERPPSVWYPGQSCWDAYNEYYFDVDGLRACLAGMGIVLDETSVNPSTGLPVGERPPPHTADPRIVDLTRRPAGRKIGELEEPKFAPRPIPVPDDGPAKRVNAKVIVGWSLAFAIGVAVTALITAVLAR
jgi:hypothetical protein